MTKPVKQPHCSIVIATKNEERILPKTLKSIKNQTYSQDLIEIIVVDNNSTDKTKSIAQQYTDKVYNQGPERGAQRNFGVQKSSGSILFFPDADMVMEKSLVEESVQKLQVNGVIGLYVPLRWRGDNWIIKAKGFEREFYDATCLDAVRVVKKTTFQQVGGYDEDLFANDDWDLNRRISQKGKIDLTQAHLYHYEDENIDLVKYIKKQIYYSPNINQYVENYGKNDPLIKKQLGFCYRYVVVFIENGKWKKILRHPLLFLQCYFLKVVSGGVFLIEKLKH